MEKLTEYEVSHSIIADVYEDPLLVIVIKDRVMVIERFSGKVQKYQMRDSIEGLQHVVRGKIGAH